MVFRRAPIHIIVSAIALWAIASLLTSQTAVCAPATTGVETVQSTGGSSTNTGGRTVDLTGSTTNGDPDNYTTSGTIYPSPNDVNDPEEPWIQVAIELLLKAMSGLGGSLSH